MSSVEERLHKVLKPKVEMLVIKLIIKSLNIFELLAES